MRLARERRRQRQPDPHRQAAARRVVGDHRAAHRLDEAARDRRGRVQRPRAAVVEALERLEQPLALLGRDPGPWSMTSSFALLAPAMGDDLDRPSRRRGAARCRAR